MDPWLVLPDSRVSRAPIAESWARARSLDLDPDRAAPSVESRTDTFRAYRDAHPLAAAMPIINKLLVRDAERDSGVIVAVGDATGRLLWIEGDPTLKRRAEQMLFMEGADWSEDAVGTSAPGTALAVDHGIQVGGPEHFATPVRQWSCTAVPIHDLQTHETLGVLDITGGLDVVAPHTLPLLEATAAAVERELLLMHLTGRPHQRLAARARAPRLSVLGRDTGLLTVGGVDSELSTRHAEILTLLAWHRGGLSADQLAEAVYGRRDAVVTLRAEMVRLRKTLEPVAPSLVPVSRPYRLPAPLDLDVRIVAGLLNRGAHHSALDSYLGPVLPASLAPGIEEIRVEIVARLRESMMESASPEVLLAFAQSPAGVDDAGVWEALLRMLPARSPRRAGIVAHLESLD